MSDLRRAAQLAVEALAIYQEHDPEGNGVADNVITALKQALAEPEQEQEPVATVVERQYEDGTYAGNALDWAGRNCEDDFPAGTKFYTAPQPVKFNCTVVDDAHPEGVPLSQWGQQQKQKPFCYHDGRNIVGKEYAHHCDVFPLYTEPQPEQEPITHAIVAGALFDFMGWLTSRKERIVLSSADNASAAAVAIHDFAEMRGLILHDPKVQDWQDALEEAFPRGATGAHPVRELKPLTDEEIGRIAGDCLDAWSCARAVEAAHGIKEESVPNNLGECSECHAPVGTVCSDKDCPGRVVK